MLKARQFLLRSEVSSAQPRPGPALKTLGTGAVSEFGWERERHLDRHEELKKARRRSNVIWAHRPRDINMPRTAGCFREIDSAQPILKSTLRAPLPRLCFLIITMK